MKNARDKFIVIIINWQPLCISSLLFIFSSPTNSNFLNYNFCSQLNDKLSPFYQYVHTLTVINYLAPPIILSFSGARACVELSWDKEARSWLHKGLTVSFNECLKRDTRCNANNISRKINTFQADSSTHNANDVLLYCTKQFKEAKILLRSSFFYSTKLNLKEEAILTNSQSFC